MSRPWQLVTLGAGTAGNAGVRALTDTLLLDFPKRITIVDHDLVSRRNTITCPEYAGYVGWEKVHATASLVQQRTSGQTITMPMRMDVEDLDWPLIAWSCDAGDLLVVLAGLDDFQSRLCVTQDLRELASHTSLEILHIQVGLGRDMGVVSTFSCRAEDACPACFLAHLPRAEPCVSFSQDGRLRQGDLQREARACADEVVRIVAGCLNDGLEGWLNRKTMFHAARPGCSQFERIVRPRNRMAGCLGPHHSAPLRWDRVRPGALEGENSND